MLSVSLAVYAWGLGTSGQLMQSELYDSNIPWAVGALDAARITCVATAASQSFAVTDLGSMLVSGVCLRVSHVA